jgi:serine/threonine protein kinase
MSDRSDQDDIRKRETDTKTKEETEERIINQRWKFIPKNAIGRGQFSKVYAGIDLQTDLKIAIKRIDLSTADDVIKVRVSEEIRIMTSLDHPNVVKTFDVGFEEQLGANRSLVVYIVMEYCSGGDFAKFINRNPMKESKARYYIHQLMKGLQYLRERSILHRDLKPANLLLSDDNQTLKIADFGFARYLEDARMTTTMCGSPLYMAPEVLFGQSYNGKSDLWSVGVILYQCVYGKMPFDGVIDYAQLLQFLRDKTIIHPKNVHISPECIDLLCGLLQKQSRFRLDWDGFFYHRWWSPERISAISTSLPSMRVRESLIDRHPSTDSRGQTEELNDSFPSVNSGGVEKDFYSFSPGTSPLSMPLSSPLASPMSSSSRGDSYLERPPSFYRSIEKHRSSARTNPISIRQHGDQQQISISFSPHVIDDYHHPEDGIKSEPSNPTQAQAEFGSRMSINTSGQRTAIPTPTRPPEEKVTSYLWSMVSSSLKTFSVFKN